MEDAQGQGLDILTPRPDLNHGPPNKAEHTRAWMTSCPGRRVLLASKRGDPQ